MEACNFRSEKILIFFQMYNFTRFALTENAGSGSALKTMRIHNTDPKIASVTTEKKICRQNAGFICPLGPNRMKAKRVLSSIFCVSG
jgi:hypothetical protein